MAGGMLYAGEIQYPVQPDDERNTFLSGGDQEFRTVACAKIGWYDVANMRVAFRITPA
jgi:hypothetical protein